MIRPLRVLAATGRIAQLFSFLMLVPIPFALVYEPWDLQLGPVSLPLNVLVFLGSFLVAAAFWAPAAWASRSVRLEDLQDREAYLTVGAGWLVLVALATLPFLFSGTLRNPADAFFEAMSGLTTTGSTVIDVPLESVDRSVMLWRGLLQYLGGMGIIVLSVALLARLTHGGMQLLAAETPGTEVTRIRPRLAQTAKTLWLLYAGFSVVFLAVFLLLMRFHIGMDWSDALYDAVLHTFTTLATGGFSNHSESMGYYDSVWVEVLVTFFMLLGGISYTLHYHWLHGDLKRLWRDQELRLYLGIVGGSMLLLTMLLVRGGESFGAAFRGVSFTVASLITSSGFGTVDFDAWPAATKLVLLLLMFTGGMSGSTSGGMKVLRVLILMKLVKRQFLKLRHPNAVTPVRMGKTVIKETTLFTVGAFVALFVGLWLAGTFVLTVFDPSLALLDAASASVSAVGNMGPGFGVVGPTQGYWSLTPLSKVVLALLMWIGRLEVFAALLVLSPRSWRS
ncbi:MAG: TrkH family potassium uptake protein [Thermoplasmatota archaeon]